MEKELVVVEAELDRLCDYYCTLSCPSHLLLFSIRNHQLLSKKRTEVDRNQFGSVRIKNLILG